MAHDRAHAGGCGLRVGDGSCMFFFGVALALVLSDFSAFVFPISFFAGQCMRSTECAMSPPFTPTCHAMVAPWSFFMHSHGYSFLAWFLDQVE